MQKLLSYVVPAALLWTGPTAMPPSHAAEPALRADSARIDMRWGVKIPMSDGISLGATLYLPKQQNGPAPCIFTLTPYVSQRYHGEGTYFAANGLPFLTIDVRGRGNSEGAFRPFDQDATDGPQIVEWLAKQPYCNGKVTMWGGSYAGFNQWQTAKELPPHLATIVPVASPHIGVEVPARNNIFFPYMMQWLNLTEGRAAQDKFFADSAYWSALWRDHFEKGAAFKDIEHAFGGEQKQMREWLAHPQIDAWQDSLTPTPEQYRAMRIPILTITGSYDADQPGALAYYRDYMRAASREQQGRHYLIIGPWDHSGTRGPEAEFGGLKFGPASLVDVRKLHVDWYRWTMSGGPKPEFLKDRVAYYVMGAEKWRYAPTLEAVTARTQPFYLDSTNGATQVMASGSLSDTAPGKGAPDSYIYDPRDTSSAALEEQVDWAGGSYTDQRLVLAGDGKQLVYHTPAFAADTEISGFFRLAAWIGIDQPDTDFNVTVYELTGDGQSIWLSDDVMRARYREGLRSAKLVATKDPLLYDFKSFTFTSRTIAKGSRLRLVIKPVNSINSEKNYNSGGVVADETMRDARSVTVRLFHDKTHPSALSIPFGQP